MIAVGLLMLAVGVTMRRLAAPIFGTDIVYRPGRGASSAPRSPASWDWSMVVLIVFGAVSTLAGVVTWAWVALP